jgi:hypothetical protein
MRIEVDERLLREVETCGLRFTCEHCAHFDDVADRCSQGFPSEEHRAGALELGKCVVFCKLFEAS